MGLTLKDPSPRYPACLSVDRREVLDAGPPLTPGFPLPHHSLAEVAWMVMKQNMKRGCFHSPKRKQIFVKVNAGTMTTRLLHE